MSGSSMAPAAQKYLWNASSGLWEAQRTPTVFDGHLATSSGSTNTIHTTTMGKAYRLLAYEISVPAGSLISARGVVQIELLDNTTSLNLLFYAYAIQSMDAIVPGVTTGWVTLGNGVVLGTGNNLMANLGASFSAGGVYVQVAGTEE